MEIELLPHQKELMDGLQKKRILFVDHPSLDRTAIGITEVSMSKNKQLVKENLDFGEAWNILLSARIQLSLKPGQIAILERDGWNGADQYVRILLPSAPHPDDSKDANPQNPYFRMADNNADAEGTLAPFAVIKTTRNQVFPWTPSQGDLFGRDYRISILG